MKKIFSLLVVVIYLFATIGCAGVCFYEHEPQFGVAGIILAAMAYPFVKKHLDNLFR